MPPVIVPPVGEGEAIDAATLQVALTAMWTLVVRPPPPPHPPPPHPPPPPAQ